jgi:hypothetical protein
MIKSFFAVALIVIPIVSQAQIPDQWNPEFTITLSYSGSMRGGSTHIEFTYDQCVFKSVPDLDRKARNHSFKMTEAKRAEILAKMRALQVDSIKSQPNMYAVNDGWSKSICFKTYCIEGGTSAELSDGDKNRFQDAFNYLQQYAYRKKAPR